MSAAARPPPPAAHTGMPARVRSLFFASVPNGLATLLMLWVLWHLVPAAWRSFVTDALTAPADIKQCVQAGRFCWSFLQDRWRQILFGTFPYAEQWRAGLACIIFLCLIVITFMVLGAPSGRRLRLVGLGFVFGVALALARREGPPLIRWLAVGYIEFLRVVPLISLLFVASILLTQGADVDRLVRTRLAFSLFFAAYMAEALRVVVPSLVNIFIAAFKDTSLVVVISMMDLLGTADIARSDAAGRLTASDRAALRAAEAAIVRLRPGQQPREMIPAIRAFHFTVYGAARMPALLRLIEGLWLRAAPAQSR